MPTVDYNSMEIELLKKQVWDMKAASAADKPQKRVIIAEIADLKQDSLTAAFMEEEKRIRLDYQDKDAWKNSNDAQRQELIQVLLKRMYPSSHGRVSVFLTKGNSKFPPWTKLSFETSHWKRRTKGSKNSSRHRD